MTRYRFSAFDSTDLPRWIVVRDGLQNLVTHEYWPPGTNLRRVMEAYLAALVADGWTVEGGHEYGSVFVHRGDERHCVSITGRDPRDGRAAHFNPFRRQE